ncbi:MAG: glutamate--tRNA ligase [Bacteroidetes bacterium]|nr:MAG: glutamate--tRNA ligase [Bacteroidota bacterium]
MNDQKIRVRFAPSPTGPLHIGGVRTALYNYLFARKHGGKVILRIEDTDQNRYVKGAEDYIIESLNWCGILFDEDIVNGGPYGPYRQSERKHIYREYAEQLVRHGYAYYAFDTPEELDVMREKEKNNNIHLSQYGPFTRLGMKNSLSLSQDEVKRRIASGEPYVIRIRIPENEEIHVNDLIRGDVLVQSSSLDDKVLFKSDGWPTYHLANIVDDHLMQISHVIRGEEWLPSAPLHVLLYRYLGWEETMPKFAHLPLLLKPDGNGKLSKRDGDRLGFPVFPLQWTDPVTKDISSGYRESGYLPDAFVNILAFLGWNPGTEQELFTMDELIHEFSIERVGKHGSKFDPEKARWYNHQYLVKKPEKELIGLLKQELEKRNLHFEDPYIATVIHLIKERANLIPDLWNNSWFFFVPPTAYDEQVVQKVWNPTPVVFALLTSFLKEAEAISEWNYDQVHAFIQDFISRKDMKMGQLMNPLRLLMAGNNQGPGIMDIAITLGKEEFLKRIETGLEKMPG